jgi:hypothetical protein
MAVGGVSSTVTATAAVPEAPSLSVTRRLAMKEPLLT